MGLTTLLHSKLDIKSQVNPNNTTDNPDLVIENWIKSNVCNLNIHNHAQQQSLDLFLQSFYVYLFINIVLMQFVIQHIKSKN